jgi:transposase
MPYIKILSLINETTVTKNKKRTLDFGQIQIVERYSLFLKECMGSDTSAKLKERELIIKLSHDGKTCREIASLLGISKSKSSYWIQRYTKTKSLMDKPKSGRPTQLNKERLKEISETIKTTLRKQAQLPGVSSREVRAVLENETGKRYSLRHTRRLLHTMGFSLIPPRANKYKKYKKAQNKYREKFNRTVKGTLWNL